MRRFMTSVVAMVAVVAVVTPAGAADDRVETFEYTAPSQVQIGPVGVWLGCWDIGEGGCNLGAVTYKTKRNEDKIVVKIVDDAGTTVSGIIIQKGLRETFCGSSGRVRIRGGKPVSIYVSANPCAATPDGVVTGGVITTRFLT